MGFPPRWLIPRSERGIAWKSLEAFTIEYKHPLTLNPILEVKDTMIFLQTYDLCDIFADTNPAAVSFPFKRGSEAAGFFL